MHLKFEKEVVISRETRLYPHFGYYGWPSVAIDENGVTYAVVSKRIRHIDPYGKVMMYRSTDRGETWDDGTCLIDSPIDDRDAGIVYMGNGRMLVTTFSHDSVQYIVNDNHRWTGWKEEVGEDGVREKTEGWKTLRPEALSGNSAYIISTDYGRTWSEKRYMPITAPHGPSMMNSGELMYLGIPHHSAFAIGEELPYRVYFYISRDGGESWTKFSELPLPEDRCPVEAYGLQLKNGTVVATARTADFHTLLLRSSDGGQTWTEPVDLTYGAPAQLCEAADGTLVLTYAKRKYTTGQCVRFSSDSGETWTDETYVSKPVSAGDWDLGYPATAQYADGTFITVYYQRWQDDTKPSLICRKWRTD